MSRAAPDGSSGPRILVSRPGAIGDTLLTYPALLRLHERFPGALIHLAGNPAVAPVLAAQRAPDGSPLLESWTAFDAAAVTGLFVSGGPPEHTRLAFGHLTHAVAWCADPDGTLATNLRRLGASRIIVAPSRPRPDAGVHVATYLVNTLVADDAIDEPLGGGLDRQEVSTPQADRPPLLQVHPRWSERADDILARLDLTGREFVLVHPGSGSPTKNWPVELYARVVAALPAALGAVPLVLTGPAEEETAERLIAALDTPVPVLRDLPLTVVAALMRWARGYLGNDSGLTHLAGLLGTSTVAIFGPTDPAMWAPLGPRVRVLRRQPLGTLAVNDVLAALAHALGSRS